MIVESMLSGNRTNKLLMPFRATEGDYAIYNLERQNNPELAKKIDEKLKQAQQAKMDKGDGQLNYSRARSHYVWGVE
jgi:hypothetical protein